MAVSSLLPFRRDFLPLLPEVTDGDGRKDRGRLLASHHRYPGVGPHVEEARAVGTAAHPVVPRPETSPDDDSHLGDLSAGDGHDQLGSVLAMPPCSASLPTTNPMVFCRNTSGIFLWQHSSMKCVPFTAQCRVQDPVVCHDANRVAVEPREPRHQR